MGARACCVSGEIIGPLAVPVASAGSYASARASRGELTQATRSGGDETARIVSDALRARGEDKVNEALRTFLNKCSAKAACRLGWSWPGFGRIANFRNTRASGCSGRGCRGWGAVDMRHEPRSSLRVGLGAAC